MKRNNNDRPEKASRKGNRAFAYITAIGIVLLTLGTALLAQRLMPASSLSLIFLTGVLICAVRTGPGPSLLASFLSFLAFNYFFTRPYYTLKVADEGDIAMLLSFLIIAIVTGNLAARMHQEMARRRASLQRVSNLYEFGRRMASAAGTAAVLDALADHLGQSLDRTVVVIMTEPGEPPAIKASAGDPHELSQSQIETAWRKLSTGVVATGSWNFFPLSIAGEAAGMIAIDGELDVDQIDLVRNLGDQAGIALDRTRLVADLEEARLVSETEQLRSALLTSVSHDLRTPLSSIIGSTTSLLEYGDSFSDENRRDLLGTVVDEAHRLDRHIQNLLDMTRLGQGNLTLNRDWVDLNDIISSAIERQQNAVQNLSIKIDIPPGLPLLWVHGVLIEQAMVNLLDNAIRFSPPGGCIDIMATYTDEQVAIEICDKGPGIPEDEWEKIFDMFYTVSKGDRSDRQGTGLGLAICRGMIAAHGGNVTAHEGHGGQGTCMRILLPITVPKPPEAK